MKLVLSACLVDAFVKGASTVALHAVSKAPVILALVGQKPNAKSKTQGLNIEKIPFFHNLETKFEDKGIRVTRDDSELTIEINDQLIIDTLQPTIQYTCGLIDMLPMAVKSAVTFDKDIKAVEKKWLHVEGFEYTEPQPVKQSDLAYKYLDSEGRDRVLEPSRIKELLEKLKGADVEVVSQNTNIPKNVLIALQREYAGAFE